VLAVLNIGWPKSTIFRYLPHGGEVIDVKLCQRLRVSGVQVYSIAVGTFMGWCYFVHWGRTSNI